MPAGDLGHPFDIPAVRLLGSLELHPSVTFFVGDNGSGKSTLLEAIAVAAGFNAEGGTRNTRFATREVSVSRLHDHLVLAWQPGRRGGGFFLRAESFFNVASAIERYDEDGTLVGYGDTPLHDQSHGESFLATAANRFEPGGVHLLDEPESALSFRGCLSLLRVVHELTAAGAQFIIATHSPVLLAFPGAWIYELGPDGVHRVDYDDVAFVQEHRSFLDAPERFLRHLFADD